ncbi:MAG TPA: hypothetical protein VI248_05055 [Kineosporiaceae bacterium]
MPFKTVAEKAGTALGAALGLAPAVTVSEGGVRAAASAAVELSPLTEVTAAAADVAVAVR